ncbi:Oxygen-independent coproporphyrinogen-III oxidase-like protein YggW [Candidatus Erwinia haradaeae]|uniref:Heme chaperone HemW n=1 Tax=Candidatus Erwinia haradaeae TaxID=1922217 RepID=A0A451DDT2_9GAMM|nr:radical SAM family heme chaperone HemW [Candidatus Erwinia haradaeae]VFP84592.1 Oxygen-independent coproporphyrinogen-III oxidase-like protein YggW [Candidatus Erwinia haradaeae]
MLTLPNLGLYIHIPWCLKKCSYCDFNSYALEKEIPVYDYINHLFNDLHLDLPLISGRKIHTIFIGGGTPSLLNSKSIQLLLHGIRTRLELSNTAEITIEVNPSILEIDRCNGYKNAGINRISIGVQSFQKSSLQNIGRTYTSHEVRRAVKIVSSLGLRSFNIDLMHGLPNQSLADALNDLRLAISFNPPHLSWYQLMIEPHTLFFTRPPQLPHEDHLWAIFEQGHKLLCAAGYQQYEISSYSKSHFYCEHNLNYWRFGDYLGIGCGAHGKLTQPDGTIIRTSKTLHPRKFMSGNYLSKRYAINNSAKPIEFFMNRFRLLEMTPRSEYKLCTGLSEDSIRSPINRAIEEGYITETSTSWMVTQKGTLFLNSLLELFLTD